MLIAYFDAMTMSDTLPSFKSVITGVFQLFDLQPKLELELQ